MNHLFLLRLACVTLVSVSVALGGCVRTQSSKFYTLGSLAESTLEEQETAAAEEVFIGVGPINIPEYLNRPQIVIRVSPNKIKLAEFHRWAEPLSNSITNIIAQNLSILLSTDRVAVFPWRVAALIEYQVRVTIIRFDGMPGKDVSLVSRWTIFGKDGEEMFAGERSSITLPVRGEGYEAMVSALDQVLAELSRDIADAISAISQEGTAQ